MKVVSHSPQQTVQIGMALGEIIRSGSVICLEGNLGAGKTQFAKGVARGLGVADHVTSPTFTIINEYEGRLPFYHIDAYRLEDPDEAYELGMEEYIFGEGVTLVEWPERVSPLIPDEHLVVKIRVSGFEEDSRELEFFSRGRIYQEIIDELTARIACDHELLRS